MMCMMVTMPTDIRHCSCRRCTQKRNLEQFGPEHIAWMRGYAQALRMTSNPIHQAQIAQIDRDYGVGYPL